MRRGTNGYKQYALLYTIHDTTTAFRLTLLCSLVNYTLSVTAVVVDDNSITLTCSSLTIPLTSKRYLKWTQRGRELPNSYHVQPLDNGGITVTIHNASYLDNGVFTCRCYNNFSVADIEEIYYSSHMYYHHCSEPFSIRSIISG